jgi:glucose 1-dehydrogenase
MPNSPASDWLGLRGRVAVVNGAGSGIGAAIARGLAEAGAKVALVDRDAAAVEHVAADLNAAGATALPTPCDVTDEASVNAAAATVSAKLGTCAILVNNAGILRAGSLESLDMAAWNQVLAVNLTAYLDFGVASADRQRRL